MKPTPPALLLDRVTVASLLTHGDCIAAVERAFGAHARGETLSSELLHVDGLDGEFHVKAGGLKSPAAYFTAIERAPRPCDSPAHTGCRARIRFSRRWA